MRRILALFLIVLLLSGCTDDSDQLDRPMALRGKIQQKEVSFDVSITADYGDKIYSFTMDCQADSNGDLAFTVTQPQSISGITGKISGQGGHLTFADKALGFEMLADGQVTPVSAPWLFVRTLRSGYISACGSDGDLARLAIYDSYQENALHLDIWLDSLNTPVRGEILWQGRRVVSLEIKNFSIV